MPPPRRRFLLHTLTRDCRDSPQPPAAVNGGATWNDASRPVGRVRRAKWSTLGQSYGGFLTLTYLSTAPEGLTGCYITGDLPSTQPDAAEVYRRTYPRVEGKNREFYQRYPHDKQQVAAIADQLAAGDVQLPDGDVLTVRRFQSLGLDFGMKPGFERLHFLVAGVTGLLRKQT